MNVRSILAPALAIALCGCANSLLYDENRDNQGKAAVKAVEEAHLTATVESLNKTFDDMAAREEANARERAEQLFEWEMQRVARAKDLKSMKTAISNRLSRLGLKDNQAATLDEVVAKADLIAGAQDEIENKLTTFQGAFAIKLDDCAAVYQASSDPKSKAITPAEATIAALADAVEKEDAKAQFKELVETCNAIEDPQHQWTPLFPGGRVMEIFAEADQLATREAEYEKQKTDAKVQLAAARKAAEPVIAAAKPGKSKREAVEAEAKKLIGIIDKVRKVNDSAGIEAFATDKLEHLEDVISAIAGTKAGEDVKLSADEQLTVGLVRELPGLVDEANKLFAEAAKPRLVPFLAAINYQKLVLEKVETLHTIDAKYKALLAAQFDAAIDEVVALATVLRTIEVRKWDKSVQDLDKELKDKDKQVFYETMGIYGDGAREARVELAVLKARTINVQYEKNLAISRNAAAQWDVLMDMTAKVLADYHGAGIKQSDLAEFFKALGLVVIGVGAAQ